MKIPIWNDVFLGKMLTSGVHPAVILWEEIDSLGWRHNRTLLELLADEFAGKILFGSIIIDENPIMAMRCGIWRLQEERSVAGVVAYVNGKSIGCIVEMVPNLDAARAFLEKVATCAPKIDGPSENGDMPE